ncbi:hypothetical protein D3C72_781300 [compost metagenome]
MPLGGLPDEELVDRTDELREAVLSQRLLPGDIFNAGDLMLGIICNRLHEIGEALEEEGYFFNDFLHAFQRRNADIERLHRKLDLVILCLLSLQEGVDPDELGRLGTALLLIGLRLVDHLHLDFAQAGRLLLLLFGKLAQPLVQSIERGLQAGNNRLLSGDLFFLRLEFRGACSQTFIEFGKLDGLARFGVGAFRVVRKLCLGVLERLDISLQSVAFFLALAKLGFLFGKLALLGGRIGLASAA